MIKKTLAVILAAAILAVSGCNNNTVQTTTTTSTESSDSADISWNCKFYAEDILFYWEKLYENEDDLLSTMFEGDSNGLKKATAQCRDTLNKFLELSCPCEQITEQHDNMIAAADKYMEFLDSMDRYAYYLGEAQNRTEFTDEEMIELQELSEIVEDPYKIPTDFMNSAFAAVDAAQLYVQ